jgi:ribosome-binding protein aMBF1 (putative translation factor)
MGSADAHPGINRNPPPLPDIDALIEAEMAQLMRDRLAADVAETRELIRREDWEADRPAGARAARSADRAARIADARHLHETGLSQSQIAARLGVHKRTVQKWFAPRK